MSSFRRLATLWVAVLLLLLAAPTVLGHAAIEESNPADGATVTTPLKGFVTFDEEVSSDPARTFVVVVNSADVEVARGEANETDATRVDLQLPELPTGMYTLRWQATTTDDNGVERGDFTFTVAAATTTAAPPTVAPTSGPTGGGNENGEETPAGNDVTLALIIAALAIAAVLAFVFLRMRRR
jgi:methionine-rich copper-binding protein CopC